MHRILLGIATFTEKSSGRSRVPRVSAKFRSFDRACRSVLDRDTIFLFFFFQIYFFFSIFPALSLTPYRLGIVHIPARVPIFSGRKCVCTSKACKEAGVDVCRTRFSCYTEEIYTIDGAARDNSSTRGCTEYVYILTVCTFTIAIINAESIVRAREVSSV